MTLEEMVDEEMCVFVAPDGSPQFATMAPDFAMCVAMGELLAKYKLGEHPAVLLKKGFKILPVKVTIVQNGDENDAFKKGR